MQARAQGLTLALELQADPTLKISLSPMHEQLQFTLPWTSTVVMEMKASWPLSFLGPSWPMQGARPPKGLPKGHPGTKCQGDRALVGKAQQCGIRPGDSVQLPETQDLLVPVTCICVLLRECTCVHN